MEIKKIIFRAKQFGGLRLARGYIKMGLGHVVALNVIKMFLGIKTRDEAYSVISSITNKKLQERYKDFILKRKYYYDSLDFVHEHSSFVWTGWLQGFDNAPKLVKACVESMKQNLAGRKIMLISMDNYRDYIDLPNDIVEKFKAGMIPPASFSDLLRLELLIKYGGTWMDATVLCTRGGDISADKVMDCDLFVFQTIVGNDKRLHGISNWFMTSCSNNRHLIVLRDVLMQYWRDYDCCLDYYIMHHFFMSIANLFPNEIAKMPRVNRLIPLRLMNRMGDRYDENWMKQLLLQTCFHKLNYRLSKKVLNDPDNFYHVLVNNSLYYA